MKKRPSVSVCIRDDRHRIPILDGISSVLLSKKQNWDILVKFRFISLSFAGELSGDLSFQVSQPCYLSEAVKLARLELVKIQDEEGEHCGLDDVDDAAWLTAYLLPRK